MRRAKRAKRTASTTPTIAPVERPPTVQATEKINESRCFEAKIEKREKAGSCQESNPGHLWLELQVL